MTNRWLPDFWIVLVAGPLSVYAIVAAVGLTPVLVVPVMTVWLVLLVLAGVSSCRRRAAGPLDQ